jgi:GAF domain
VEERLFERRVAIERERAGDVPPGSAVADTIRASWSRCQDLLDDQWSNVPVGDDSIGEQWTESPIRRLAPHLVSQLASAGSDAGMLTIVTDRAGQVLWDDTPADLRRPAHGVGLIPGGRWDEPVAGTNGIGMALVTGRPSVVFATEHWCTPVRDWVCYSAPVHTVDGVVAGVIDLSTTWDRANPLALGTVGAIARLIEVELAAAAPMSARGLAVHALGRGRVVLDGVPLALGPRQIELLVVLAVAGTATLDELHGLLFGDRPISMATLRAEISHTRAALGGAIASRPYRLTVPVRLDALETLDHLRRGDLDGAIAAYAGQLLPTSDAPLIVERRFHLDVALRTALLLSGNTRQLLGFASVHPFDVEVLHRAVDVAAPGDPDLPAAVAALAVATADL